MTIKQVTVRLVEIRALLLFASTDKTRFSLCGINIECAPNKRPILIATDGRKIGLINSETNEPTGAEPFAVFLENRVLKSLFRLVEPKDDIVTITATQAEISLRLPVSGKTLTTKNESWEWAFPNWRQVIPEAPTSAPSAMLINANFLLAFARAAELLRPSKKILPCIQMRAKDEGSPIEVRCPKAPNFYGVLMPARRGSGDYEVNPFWLPETAQQKAA